MTRKERYEKVLAYFRQEMPEVTTELDYGSTFQLLVAVILSAQCTDKRINQVTPALFRDYPTAHELANAEDYEIFEYIKTVSYPNAKAKHLVAMAKMLVSSHGGDVPCDMNQLLELPGVGRKTANVMKAVAFGQSAMPVDTHVYRVSHRLKLVSVTDNTPLKVEQRLSKHIPSAELSMAHHWLILHGRYVCTAKKPHCDKCGLREVCGGALKS